jgi:hypothetical protein
MCRSPRSRKRSSRSETKTQRSWLAGLTGQAESIIGHAREHRRELAGALVKAGHCHRGLPAATMDLHPGCYVGPREQEKERQQDQQHEDHNADDDAPCGRAAGRRREPGLGRCRPAPIADERLIGDFSAALTTAHEPQRPGGRSPSPPENTDDHTNSLRHELPADQRQRGGLVHQGEFSGILAKLRHKAASAGVD